MFEGSKFKTMKKIDMMEKEVIFQVESQKLTFNKRRSRNAVFTVKVADKKLAEKTVILTHKPNLTKNNSIEILSKEFKPIPSEINQSEN